MPRMKRFLGVLIAIITVTTAISSVDATSTNGAYMPLVVTGWFSPGAGTESKIFLGEDIGNKGVEAVSVEGRNGFIPVKTSIEKDVLSIVPATDLTEGALFTIRIFAADDSCYTFTITASNMKPIDLSVDNYMRIPANPAKGFHFPYLLYIPAGADTNKLGRMVVESNNSSPEDALEYHAESARTTLKVYMGAYTAQQFKIPMLVPVFPRPFAGHMEQPYMQFLNRKSLSTTDPQMKRADLQLVQMIADAQALLKANGVAVDNKVFLTGFSSSAKFAQRFATLHPEKVRALFVGGVASTTTLPMKAYKGKDLRYPVGVADLKQLTGIAFNATEYKKISQFIYMGSNDNNDATQWPDCFEDQDAELIWSILGKKQLFDRWFGTQNALKAGGFSSAVQFHVYKGEGHNLPLTGFVDVLAFFKANNGNGFTSIQAHEFGFEEKWYEDVNNILKDLAEE